MKKNAMLKIAAVLLVAVLLTTCAISSTFAKYVTSDADKLDSARVAKWGVAVNVTTADLFLTEYNGGTEADAPAKVIAPGTTNSVTLNSVVTGTPEVTGKITYSVKIAVANFPDDDIPTTLTFKAGETTLDAATYVNTDDYVKLPDGFDITFDPGDDLSAKDTLTISWNWALEGDDEADTKAGNAAADPEATDPTVTVFVKVDVVQTAGPVVGGAA